ncbi:MAG TPA: HEAT repeat domain-containing protein [Ktedonobacteraceae bacterium]|nr:HEAT repeat domain-containing protein [Ktedonobacteraceae bacterium]
MRRKLLTIGIAGIVLTLLAVVGIIATTNTGTEANYIPHYFAMAAFAGPTPTATASPSGGGETAIPVAIIGLIGSIVAALIAGGFLLYNSHRTRKAESQATQTKQIQEQEEQDRRRNAELAEAQRLNQNKQKRLAAYCATLRTDSRIAYLQILNHGQPVKVLDMYVPIRVHRETKLSHKPDPMLLVATIQQDPTTLIHATQQLQERRYSLIACDPDEAIRLHKRCVILGDPGAGKSTLLKYLALQSAGNNLQGLPNLPIHIELHHFAASGTEDLLDFAAERWVSNYGFDTKVQARDLMEENLRNGNALLLLDALDESMVGESKEIADESYKRVFGAISRAATRYPQATIVITGRKAGYEQHALLGGFTELEVVDFRPEDIEQFVNKWFQSYNDPLKEVKASDLNARLKHNPRIQALAANPLLLTLIVTSYEQALDLPLNRAELYKQCVETLLSEWDAKRDILRRRQFKRLEKKELLAEIAWHFHRKRQYLFSEKEILKQIGAFLPAIQLGNLSDAEQVRESRTILEEIANENGLLKKQTFDQYAFLHFTLQEYFAAQYVALDRYIGDQEDLNILLEHRGDLWWEEVILLYVGQLRDASPVLHRLLGDGKQSLREDIFHTNLLLAGRCLASLSFIRDSSLREAIVNLLFATLEQTPYTLTQEQVASILVAIGSTAAITRLVYLLSKKEVDHHIRLRVVQALGGASERSAVTQALFPLLSNKKIEWEVRASIAEALGSLGERYIMHDLLHMLTDEQIDWQVRWSIAHALGILGEKSIAHNLVSLLADERLDWRVRWSIAHALGTLGEKSVARDLLGLLTNPKLEQSVCQSIIRALGMLKEQSIARDLLTALSKDRVDKVTALFLADALGRLGDRSVAPDLLRMLSNERMNWQVRSSIAKALSSMNASDVVPDLITLLTQEQIDRRVRSSIAQALGTLGVGRQTVAPALLKMLPNQKIQLEVRASIANALGMLGDRSVAPGLQSLLTNTDIAERVRLSIVEALGKLGERSVARDLLGLLQDQQADEFMRQRVAQAILGTLGEWSVSPALLQHLFEEQILQQEPQKIADVLSKSDDQSVVPDLMHLLSEEQVNTLMRQLTVSSLVGESSSLPVSELAGPDAIEKINKVAHQIIAQALGTLGEPSIVPDLLNLLSSKEVDRDVRKSIAEALGQLANDETTVQSLAQLLQTSDIADEIYRVLWTVSRRVGVRVFLAKGQMSNLVEIIKVET